MRRTKSALRTAIVELVLEKGYESITVDGVAERADTTRATFYSHYQSKEDLLADVVDAFAADVRASYGITDTNAPPNHRLAALFEHARSSRDVVRVIVLGEGDGVALRRFTAAIEEVLVQDEADGVAPKGTSPQLEPELIVKMRAAQIVAATSWFVEHDLDATEFASAVNQAIERGWHWAAGVDPRA